MSLQRSPITTHVLDLDQGLPKTGLPVILEREISPGNWNELSRKVTNADGRVEDFLPAGSKIQPGNYRLNFETTGFYPVISITFAVEAGRAHTHVPLLLNRFGYSTYRGT